MSTIAQMLANKTLKRTDQGMMIKLADLHEKPGFNWRDEGEDLEATIDALAQFIIAKGPSDLTNLKNLPPVKIEPRTEGGAWVVEGHRRRRALLRAMEVYGASPVEKDGLVWLYIKPFTGDEKAKNYEVFNSQSGEKLKPMEQAKGFQRLVELGDTPEEIAKNTGCARQWVDSMLILANAPDSIKTMVRSGQVSADVASENIRRHGDEAEAFLIAEYDKAKAQGKTKVTRGTIKGKALPSNVVADLTSNLKRVVQAIPAAAKDTLEQYRTGSIADPETMVSMPVRELLALVMCADHVDDVRAEQERKAQAKAEKAEKAAAEAKDNAEA